MENGRPPYGGSPWSQQPSLGQNPPGQYSGQYPANSGSYLPQTPGTTGGQQPYGAYDQSSWQVQTYQAQERQAQESYVQQSWQPYQQSYEQQGYGQQSYAQQGFGQQPYVQQPYQQQSYTMQPYAPQTYGLSAQDDMYRQRVNNQQPLQQGYTRQEPATGQFYPAQGYSGYVSAPRNKEPVALSPEVILKVVLLGVLPVLFILGVLLRQPVLCVLFILAAAGTMAFVWLKELLEPQMRFTATVICGILGVIALITTFMSGSNEQAANGSVPPGNAGGANAGLVMESVYSPTPPPTPTVDPYAEAGAAVEQLQSFFYFWHVNNDESMVALTAPSWRNSVSNPKMALFEIRKNRIPLDDCEITISGSEQDEMRKAKVKVSIDKNNGRAAERYAFDVIMLKEDGVWYIDPRSLESNEKESTDKPSTNTTPTQYPLNTGAPNLVLYYNPDGGTYYHIDAYCQKVGSQYKPLRGQFLYSQLNSAPYNTFEQCSVCGAPLREN